MENNKLKIMRKIVLLMVIMTLIIQGNGFAQDKIFIDEKVYETTNSWDFKIGSLGNPSNPNIRVGKHSNNGYLIITINDFSNTTVAGTLYIFLEDDTIIKCYDKGVTDKNNGKTTSVYYLTKSEIERLKNYRITKVRYTIKRVVGSDNYTANNSKGSSFSSISRFTEPDPDYKDYYETDKEIRKLFQ